MRAKLRKPGSFYRCKKCKTDFPGTPMKLDGWVDKDKDWIGSITEYPTIEDAEAAVREEYRPATRVNTEVCAQQCHVTSADYEIYQIWECGNCGSADKNQDVVAECCD